MPSQVASQTQCLQNGTNPFWVWQHQTQCYHCAVCVLSCFSFIQLFATPWTAACQAPVSIRFSRQVGLPSPPLGDLPDPGIKPTSLVSPALAGGFFTTSATWEAPLVAYCSSDWFLTYIPIQGRAGRLLWTHSWSTWLPRSLWQKKSVIAWIRDPWNVNIRIPETLEYVSFHGRRDFANVIGFSIIVEEIMLDNVCCA